MLRIKVTIRDNDYPSRFIEMKMEDYIDFIEEQATLLGITKKKEQPIYLVGFDEGSHCEGCEFSSKIDGLCDLQMNPDCEEGSTLYCEKKEENK